MPAPTTLTWFNVALGWNKTTAVAGLEALEDYVRNTMPAELNFRVSVYDRDDPGIEGLYHGTEVQMRAAMAPLLTKAAPMYNYTTVNTTNWLDMVLHYAFFDTIDWVNPSPQENFYSKSLTLKGLNGTSAKNFVNYWFDSATKIVDRNWWFQLDMHGGKNSAVAKVANNATAYAHRDKLYIIQFYDRIAETGRAYPADGFSFLDGWVNTTTAPLIDSDHGAYINYADPRLDRATAQKLYYGDNLRQLQKLKAKFDPTELFYSPLSIQPIA